MDPQVKSVLTTIGASVASLVAGAAVAHGVITQGQEAAFVDIVVTVAGAVVTALLGWYKARQLSPTAAIQQVNAQSNGVKVVPADAPVAAVNAPQKETK